MLCRDAALHNQIKLAFMALFCFGDHKVKAPGKQKCLVEVN